MEEQNKGGLVEQAKHTVNAVTEQAREQVAQKAVGKMSGVTEVLRWTSDKLKDAGPLGQVSGRAADSIERVSHFIEDKNVGDVVRSVERFARREPAIFLGAAFALGLIGGRFLKSSSGGAESSMREQESGGIGERGYQERDWGYDRGQRYDREPTYGMREQPFGGTRDYGTREQAVGMREQEYGTRTQEFEQRQPIEPSPIIDVPGSGVPRT